MEVKDEISPCLGKVYLEPDDDDKNENAGIEGPFGFDRHFKRTFEMFPNHSNFSFNHIDSNCVYGIVTQNLVMSTRLARNLPEGFLPIPYYGVWIKYLEGYKNCSVPLNSLFLRQYMVQHKQAFDDIMDGFRPEFKIRKSWIRAPLPEDLYKPWERAPTNTEEHENYVYSPTSVFCDSGDVDIEVVSEVEQQYDLMAFRSFVYMNLRLWNPVNEEIMLKASKNLRKITRKRLFGLFNGLLEQSWDRRNDDNEDETFKQDLEKRRNWSKYVMVWNAFMVDAVIYIDVVQNMAKDALPPSLELRSYGSWEADESQIDVFYNELRNFKINMSIPFFNTPAVFAIEGLNEPMDNGIFKEVLIQVLNETAIHVKKLHDPSYIFLMDARKNLGLNGVVNHEVLGVSDETVVDGPTDVHVPDEKMIDVVNINVEDGPAVPIADVPNDQEMDVAPVAVANASNEPLVPNDPVVPAAGIPSLLSLNLTGFNRSAVPNIVPSGFQPDPAIGLPPPPLMELPIPPPPGFANNQLPPHIFRANTPYSRPVTPGLHPNHPLPGFQNGPVMGRFHPQQPPNFPHLGANIHRPDTPFWHPNQPPPGIPNNHLPPFMRADTPFPHFRPNTPHPRPDTPFFHPNRPLPGFQNGPVMQWHNPQHPPNFPHLGADIQRPDNPFLPPGFQNYPFLPPYHPYMRPQTPIMHPNLNAHHHQYGRPPRRAARRGRRQ